MVRDGDEQDKLKELEKMAVDLRKAFGHAQNAAKEARVSLEANEVRNAPSMSQPCFMHVTRAGLQESTDYGVLGT